MNLEIEQQLEENKTLFKDILDGETMELTRKNIQKATPNGINVVNNGFAYSDYFKMGGTVAKMSLKSTKNYYNYIKNKNVEQEEC
tara:strand:+ start:1019 stop:1273 length:255 start_codon:yes stop_codon:yes gene_type:complete